MRWTQPTDESREEGEDGQSFRCHWTGCLCFCAPAEGRRTCSAVAWGDWSVAWTVRWGSCVQRRSLPTASPFPLGPTAAPPPGQPGDAPADLSCFPALWLSPTEDERTQLNQMQFVFDIAVQRWTSACAEPSLCGMRLSYPPVVCLLMKPFGTVQLGVFEAVFCCPCLGSFKTCWQQMQ